MSTTLLPEVEEPLGCTLGDLFERFGPMPDQRIRRDPEPGLATEEDVLAIHVREKRCYELVDGILVEKTMGQFESMAAMRLIIVLGAFVRTHRLGEVFGEAGFMKLKPGLIRIPDVSFVSKTRLKAAKLRPGGPIVPLVPELAVEVISPGNTKQEMDQKLIDYFAAGVQLVWYIDPRTQTAAAYLGTDRCQVITAPGTLTGAPVLPGLTISLAELFAPPTES